MPELYKKTKWLRFFVVDRNPKNGTCEVEVWNKDQQYLGMIEYYPKWRKYVFTPELNFIFDTNCLRDISDMMSELLTNKGVPDA